MYSLGYSNITPWESFRELPEDRIEAMLDDAAARMEHPERAVFNVHVPPFDTGLDEAPVLDSSLTVQQSAGATRMAPVGSPAVRAVLERVQPLLGLHGHIHESAGFRQLGRTLAVNPGSDYGTGTLNGVLVTLEPDRVKAHQLVRG
jgi:Icc-related predicted phosphoesterase